METRIRVAKDGRLVLPAKLRKALKIQAGDEIIAKLENDSIRLIPIQQAVTLAQQAVKAYVPQGTSLVDDLIKARREGN